MKRAQTLITVNYETSTNCN